MRTNREYARVHYAARKIIGECCMKCGAIGKVHAALRPDVSPEKLKVDEQTGCKYSIDVTDYYALCIPCHRKQDLVDARTHCAQGHEWNAENTHIKAGARTCRVCAREREAKKRQIPEYRTAKNASDKAYRKAHPMTPEQKAHKVELQRRRRALSRSAD